MRYIRLQKAIDPILWSCLLWASMMFWGWVLVVYQMPVIGWLGTILCILHLGWAGSSAIALSSTWLLFVFLKAAQNSAKPLLWTWFSGPMWAISLLTLWGMAMITLFVITQTHQRFAGLARPYRFFLLVSLNLAGVWIGTQLGRSLLPW